MSVIGLDGCKIGWVFVKSSESVLSAGVATTIEEILANSPEATSVFVDIPIGLRDDSEGSRECDDAARKLLGPKRASSVFQHQFGQSYMNQLMLRLVSVFR